MSDQGVTKWKMVPVEPTEAMMERAGEIITREYAESDWETAKDMAEGLNPRPIWDWMLQAAPTPPPLPTQQELSAAIWEAKRNWDVGAPAWPGASLHDSIADAIHALLNRGR